jgi:gliding motility-associated-like protein
LSLTFIIFAIAWLSVSYSFAQRTATSGQLQGLSSIAGTINSTRLADDKVLIIYRDETSTTTASNLKAVIGTVSGSNISLGTVANVATFTGIMDQPQVVALSPSKAVVIWERNPSSGNDELRYNVLDISGTSITVGTEGQFSNASVERSWLQSISLIALNSTQVVVSWETTPNQMALVAGTVSGTSITWGTTNTSLTSNNISYTSLVRMNNSKFAVAYEDNGAGADGMIAAGTVDGSNAITFGTSELFEFTASDVGFLRISALSETELAVAYEDDGGTDQGKLVYATLSGTDFTFPGTPATFFSGGSISEFDMDALSSSEVIIAVDGGGVVNSQYFTALRSGNNFTVSSATDFLTDFTDDVTIIGLTSDVATIAYTDDNGVDFTADFGAVRVITIAAGTNPEINVQGNSTNIVLGDASPTTGDHTDFGTGATLSRTFTIQNTGTGTLTLGSNAVTITGTNAADYSVNTQPATTVASSGSTTFIIDFASAVTSARTAEIHINSDDIHESDYFFAITAIGAAADVTAPVFSSVSPSSSSTVTNANVGYTLSEAIASGTVTFTRTGGTADGSSPHVVNLTGAELNTGVRASAALTSAPTLVSGAIYTISFNGTDAAGNGATTINSTAVTFDGTAPTFNSAGSTPNDNATNVSVSADLVIDFSENIVKGTGNIIVKIVGGATFATFDATTATATTTPASGAIGIVNDKVYLNPTNNLVGETSYAIQIAATAIDDAAGNSFVGITNETDFNFTTADVTNPTFNSAGSTPNDDATNVSVSADLVIDFSENIVKGTGNIIVKIVGGATVATFDAATATATTTPASGAIGIVNDKVYLNPSANLSKGTAYAIQVAATAIDDVAGNSFAGISNDTDFNFTTIANQLPTFTTLTTHLETTNEDTGVEITFAEIAAQANETDGDGSVTAFVVKVLSSGTLTINGNPFNATTNNEITAAKSATWTPATNANGTLNAFTITAKDDEGGESVTPVQSTVSVTAINDDPTLIGLPVTRPMLEDLATNVDLTAVTFADVDAGANNVVMTMTVSAGVLTVADGSGVNVTEAGSGTAIITLTGTAANIDTYLNTASNIKFTPPLNSNSTQGLTIKANDGGNTGSGGGADVTYSDVFLQVTAINDVPTFTMGANQTVAQNAGAQTVNGFISVFDDGDAQNVQTTQFNITNNTNASLFTGAPAISATGVLTFTPDATKFGKATISVTISDNGGTANGGVNTSPAQTFDIFVTPTNIKINEVHAVAAADGEFIEVYNTNANATNLAGLVMVWFNGNDDLAYKDFDLTGSTSASGFYVIGETNFASKDQDWGATDLQNGPDAVAIYVGSAADFTAASAPTLDGLVDVIVYGSSDDAVLRTALGNPALQVAGDATNSISRSPDGTGAYVAQAATPQTFNDITAPTVTSVAVPGGTSIIGQNFDFTVNTNENVIVNTGSGIPSIAITIGATSRQAVYTSGSGSQALVFRYQIVEGDLDTDGIVLGTLSLNSGTMKDAAGNNLLTTLNNPGNVNASLVDGVRPRITSIERQSPTGSPTNADVLVWDVTFDQAVNNVDGPDFTVTGSSATVSSVTNPSGNIYRITVSGGNLASLNATVTLGFAGAQNIRELSGNALTNTTPTGANNNTFVVDNTAPRITSIVRQSPTTSPTNADALVWDVTFDEAVANVNTADFSVSGTTATVASVTNPSGNVYRVTASGGDLANLNATVSLSFAGGQDITDAAGNALVNTTPTGTNNNTFVVDNTAPRITSIVRQSPTTSPTNADALVWDLTFDEAVANVNTADFSVSGTTATIASVTNPSGNVYRVTASGGDLANLNATVTLSFAGGQDIADAVGNALVNTTPTGTNNNTFVVDNTAPRITSIVRQSPATSPTNADALVWDVTFDEAVANVNTADFSVSGTTATIASVTNPSGNVYRVTASGGNLASLTATVTLSFAGGQDITDPAGNALVNTTPTGTNNNAFDVDNTSPTVTNVTSAKADATYGIGEQIDITVTFSKVVTVTGTPQLELETGVVDRTINYLSGTGSNTLTFRYTTAAGDESADLDYKGTTSLTLNGGTINDGVGNAATLTLVSPGAANSLGNNKAIVIAAFPTVTLSVGTASIAEAAGTSTITATLSAVSTQDVTVTLAYTGTATNGTDYNNTASTTITITAGNLSANAAVGITATQDVNPELNETIIINITGVTKGTENGNQQQTITIIDDDTPSIQFNATASNGAESVASANLQVDLSIASGLTVTVDYAVTGTATGSGTDYTLANGTLTLNPADVNKNITIAGIVDDAILEANETVIITLSNPSNANLGANTVHTYTINNNDAAAVTIADVSGAENGGAITVTATLDNAVQGGFTVDVSSADGTATIADSDYTAIAGQTLTFTGTAGETKTFTLTPTGDTKFETNETVTISQGNLAATSLGVVITDGATVTINNDDTVPTVTLSVGTANIVEAAGTSTITATLSNLSVNDVTVTLAYSGTATNGTDYNNTASTTITITAGNLTANAAVGITATQDVNPELNETIIIDITGVTNGTENGTQQQTITIIDDDTPSIQFNATASNGAESVASANLQVDLSIASGLTVTVDYSVTGTATGSGTDYTLANGTLTFNPADVNKNITIAGIIDDAILEANETVIVTLSNPTNANLGANTVHTYSINNNDAAAVTIADVSGAENGGAITVTATLDNAVQGGFTVDVSSADGTATIADSDYTAIVNQTLTFTGTAGETKTFTLTPTGDTKFETNETVTISQGNLAATSLGVVITDGATVTINNDDTVPTVTLSVGNTSIVEASGTSTITATLSNLSVNDVTVTLAYSGTATNGTDYNNTASTTIVVTAGNLSANAAVGITATQDVNPEVNETIIIDITGVTNGTENGTQQQTITIIDDDTPSIQFNATASNGAESVASANLQVDLSIASGLTVTVDYAVTGTATGSGTDYTLANGTLTFNPADVNKNITIAGIIDDAILEANETVIITLSNPSNANLGANTVHTYSINNNDAAAVTIADVSGAENGGVITVTATLDNAVQGGFTVDVSSADGTATIADSDYTAIVNQTLTFTGTAGETKTFTLTPTGDNKFETNETVTISQGNLAATSLGVVITDGATVTINNDDSAAVTIADATGAENGGAITVTATLNNAVQGGFKVDVNTANGTAVSASDYTAIVSQTLTFVGTAGETQTFTVTPTNDAIEEASESLTVSMNNLAATTLAVTISDGATITITDDDDNTAPTGFTVSWDDALVNSNELATTKFTFAGAEVATTYNYSVSDGNTTITATGTIITATDKITLASLSGLRDGTLTLSVTLKDASNNTSSAQTATTVKKAIIAAPTLSPADNSVDILPDANLVMTFGESMNKGVGNIIIKKSSDNSILETIDVTSAKVTISGAVVTINPDNAILPPASEFYVNIGAGAFKDNFDNGYAGISNNTDWTFTIIAAPVVTSVSVPANRTYKIGDVLDFTVAFTLPVTTTGTPSIPLTIGTSAKTANLKSTATNSSTAVFSYTVVEGDLDTDGIAVGATMSLNAGTIKDQFNTNALLALNNVAATTSINIDGIRPVPTITSSAVALVNGAFTTEFEFNESVTGFDQSDISIINGTVSNFANITAGTKWSASITPIADGTVTINLVAGIANDVPGNTSAAGTAITREFDGTFPTVISINRTGTNPILVATAGFRVIYSENVTGVDLTDFEVVLTGSATGTLGTVTQVDAKTYDVSVTGVAGQGSIGLNIKDDDSIRDAATNRLGGTGTGNGVFTGQTYVTNFIPTDISINTPTINENNGLSAEVGTLSTTDADVTNTHTYALVAGNGAFDNGSFLIAGNKLFAGAVFNFEVKAVYSIRIRTTDNNGGSFEKIFVININDVNEVPTNMTLSNNEIDEDDVSGLLVGQMTSSDVDDAETFTYSLVTGQGDANNLLFTFTGDELRTAAAINFETSTTLSIRVRVTDSGGLSYEEAFEIIVNNVELEPIRKFDKDKKDAKIKNFFSPNEDGTNDAWVVDDILDNPINEVKVFSQNGTLLFSERNYKNTWKGTFNGKAIPPGTYYYEINIYNGESIIKGFLTIIRSKNQ